MGLQRGAGQRHTGFTKTRATVQIHWRRSQGTISQPKASAAGGEPPRSQGRERPVFTEASTWTGEAETCPILWTRVSPDDKARWRAPAIRQMRQPGCRAAGMNLLPSFLLTLYKDIDLLRSLPKTHRTSAPGLGSSSQSPRCSPRPVACGHRAAGTALGTSWPSSALEEA